MKKFLLLFFCYSSLLSFSQNDSIVLHSLKNDAYLHPVDYITPYTLKKGEWIYAQSIQTLPFPSWAFVGVTDKLTAQIDLLPWIFGSFTELKKPIPSLNFRYKITDQDNARPTFAIEAMVVHFWDTLHRFETNNISVWEKGSYYHIKPVIGYKVKDWSFNFSFGADYIGKLIMENKDSLNFVSKTINNRWSPNYSLGIGFRPSNWISYHIGYTYGGTLTYLENVPRKAQLTYGFRLAPFYKSRKGFLNSFRVELVSINAFFNDVKANEIFPLPLFPYFYWQWKRK